MCQLAYVFASCSKQKRAFKSTYMEKVDPNIGSEGALQFMGNERVVAPGVGE